MADVFVAVVTFTKTEETAVRELLSRLYISPDVFGPTVWSPMSFGEFALEGTLPDGRVVRLEHRSLVAQGNVIAAAELSRSANAEERADYYVFYGCCGAVEQDHVGEVFRVASVSYMSLGVVADAPDGGEVVKLKNKWIVHTYPEEQRPLDTIVLPAGAPGTPGFVTGIDLPTAHVLATDKVINRAPGDPPTPLHTGPTGPVYPKDDWTYTQAIAQYVDIAVGPVLIDMETFGIASTMRAAGLSDGVIVLRVVTDYLSDKPGQGDDQQLALLRGGSAKLAMVIADILGL